MKIQSIILWEDYPTSLKVSVFKDCKVYDSSRKVIGKVIGADFGDKPGECGIKVECEITDPEMLKQLSDIVLEQHKSVGVKK